MTIQGDLLFQSRKDGWKGWILNKVNGHTNLSCIASKQEPHMDTYNYNGKLLSKVKIL